jgi:hypothetical protein
MHSKYPNLEKTNCINKKFSGYIIHIDNVSAIYAGFSTPSISIDTDALTRY